MYLVVSKCVPFNELTINKLHIYIVAISGEVAMQNKSFLFGCLIMVNYDYFRFYRGSENEDLEDFFSKEIESQV